LASAAALQIFGCFILPFRSNQCEKPAWVAAGTFLGITGLGPILLLVAEAKAKAKERAGIGTEFDAEYDCCFWPNWLPLSSTELNKLVYWRFFLH